MAAVTAATPATAVAAVSEAAILSSVATTSRLTSPVPVIASNPDEESKLVGSAPTAPTATGNRKRKFKTAISEDLLDSVTKAHKIALEAEERKDLEGLKAQLVWLKAMRDDTYKISHSITRLLTEFEPKDLRSVAVEAEMRCMSKDQVEKFVADMTSIHGLCSFDRQSGAEVWLDLLWYLQGTFKVVTIEIELSASNTAAIITLDRVGGSDDDNPTQFFLTCWAVEDLQKLVKSITTIFGGSCNCRTRRALIYRLENALCQ